MAPLILNLNARGTSVIRFKLLEVRKTVIPHITFLTDSRKPEYQVKECEGRELLS